eukprot:m.150797 g.150797  ORF g.150797 m.150797 type:complete len:276 (+) comp17831_c0_seq1:225-1052(+)
MVSPLALAVVGVAGVVTLVAIVAIVIRRSRVKDGGNSNFLWSQDSSKLEILHYQYSDQFSLGNEDFESIPLDDVAESFGSSGNASRQNASRLAQGIRYSDVPKTRKVCANRRGSSRAVTPSGGMVQFVTEPLSPYCTPVVVHESQYIHLSVEPSTRGILGVTLECNETDPDEMPRPLDTRYSDWGEDDHTADSEPRQLCTASSEASGGGVRVQRVLPGHVAWRGGELMEGDEIISIAGRPVTDCRTVEDVQRVYACVNRNAIATQTMIDVVVRRS